MIKYFFLFLLVVSAISCTSTGGAAKNNEPEYSFQSLDSLKGASVSGYVEDMKTGEVLLSENAGLRMTPASLSKIFTTSAALGLLGPDFTYQTVIAKNGEVRNGRLYGDIVVVGGGDPTLASKYFTSGKDELFAGILNFIKKAGITSVSGKLIVVSSYFAPPAYPSLRLWEDMSNYYGAPPSSLTFMDNTFKVYLSSPAKTGELCKVTEIKPDVGVKLDCRVVSAPGKKDSAYIYGFPGLHDWYIDGSIPAGRKRFPVKGAMPFPEKVFARMLSDYLKRKGMNIEGFTIRYSPLNVNVEKLGVIYSPPLKEIIKVVNKRSVNLFADHLFLTLGKQKGKADWDNARTIFTEFWNDRIGENDIHFHDGSGLSPFNYFTPVAMVRALKYNAKSTTAKEFKASLAISGIDGTFKKIWNSDKTRGRVIGKSGYLQGVLGYAGYITTASGRELAFCIMVNHFSGKVSRVRDMIEREVERIITEN